MYCELNVWIDFSSWIPKPFMCESQFSISTAIEEEQNF